MAVETLMIADGPAIYYNETFRAVLEDHMNFLRTNPSTTALVVSPGEAYRFEADLYGFLSKYSVPAYLHWVVMRMNLMSSPDQFNSSLAQLLVPETQTIDRIRQSHQMSRRVT